MTPLEATELVYAAAVAGVAAMSPAPTLMLEGELGRPAIGTRWIRLAVRDQPSPPMTHGPSGGRRVQRGAVLLAQCFAPVGTADGVKAALTMATEFRALFEGEDVGECAFGTADTRRVGIEGGWMQVNAECPFTYEATV